MDDLATIPEAVIHCSQMVEIDGPSARRGRTPRSALESPAPMSKAAGAKVDTGSNLLQVTAPNPRTQIRWMPVLTR